MGGAVAVVLVGVVVAAFGPEEEGGQDEETAAANQDCGKGEAVEVHSRVSNSLTSFHAFATRLIN